MRKTGFAPPFFFFVIPASERESPVTLERIDRVQNI